MLHFFQQTVGPQIPNSSLQEPVIVRGPQPSPGCEFGARAEFVDTLAMPGFVSQMSKTPIEDTLRLPKSYYLGKTIRASSNKATIRG